MFKDIESLHLMFKDIECLHLIVKGYHNVMVKGCHQFMVIIMSSLKV